MFYLFVCLKEEIKKKMEFVYSISKNAKKKISSLAFKVSIWIV